jgi:hypothetical protein
MVNMYWLDTYPSFNLLSWHWLGQHSGSRKEADKVRETHLFGQCQVLSS